jgi:hypothetical protein
LLRPTDDLDDFLVDDEPQPKKAPKSKAKPAPASRPLVSRPSGSGSLIKTQAELAKEKAQSRKEANEHAFSFLQDRRDVSLPTILVSPSQKMMLTLGVLL